MNVSHLTLLLVAIFGIGSIAYAGQPDKDKTPPIISELHTDSITDTSALILWTTDEPADSSIRYGIPPADNKKGPEDSALVLSHAIALSALVPETLYGYCVESRDESHNKAESCGTFTTTGGTPPPSGGGAPRIIEKKVTIEGFAYPDATVHVTLKPFLFGTTVEKQATASSGSFFKMEIDNPPKGFSSYFITATDTDGRASTRKGVQFEYRGGDAELFKKALILPPTISVEKEVVAQGDDITVSGIAQRNTSVLVEMNDVVYETKSDQRGMYRTTIRTIGLAPGKYPIRARSSMISDLGYDYSLSTLVTISGTSVPEADLNADGVVDIQDFSSFLANPQDVNGDKKIDVTDVSIFLRAF